MKKSICILLVLLCALLGGCQNTQDTPEVSYDSVEQINAEAQQAYDTGDYAGALRKYTQAMKTNPIDMDAIVGAVQCQIALENYDVAEINLFAAINLDPKVSEIYDLFVTLSEESDQIAYARTAVLLAKEYGAESFLAKVPDSPVLDRPEGKYDARFQVAVSSEPGTEIFVDESTDLYMDSYSYTAPIQIMRGKTNLGVYCVRDGIPSETVEAQYVCDYPAEEVTFTDPTIEKLVRLELGRESGPITDVDCESIYELQQSKLRNSGMDSREYENLRVNTLEDLRQLPYLRYLSLENAAVQDYSPMLTCRWLNTLELDNCGLTDISFVENIHNLGYFSALNNQISDISPLSNCEDLYQLRIAGNPVKDISVLAETNIEYLHMSASNLEDLSVFHNLKSLTNLHIYGCGGRDLSVLGALAELETLGLYADDFQAYGSSNSWGNWTPLSGLGFISNLEKLETLNLQGISDYSELNHVRSLKNLTRLFAMNLDHEPMPQELFQELQTALPGCTVDNSRVYYS